MPDLDLRQALHDLADSVTVVDLVPGTNRQLRARRRLRVVAAAAGIVVVSAGGVVAVHARSSGGSHRAPAVTNATPTPSPTPTNATRSVLPAWLPAGVTLAGHGDVPLSPAHSSPPPGWQPVARAWYRIAGRANANTIPPGGVTAQNDSTVHPATTLDIFFNPNIRTMPDVPTDPQYFFRRSVTIAGNGALLSTSKNGYGVVRIDWVDGLGYHLVMCQRLKTVEGPSGLRVDELIRIARSLYPDSR